MAVETVANVKFQAGDVVYPLERFLPTGFAWVLWGTSVDWRVLMSACRFVGWECHSWRSRTGHGDRPEQWSAICATPRPRREPGSDGLFEGRSCPGC